MKPNEESVVIAEHSIESEQTLRLAAKIGLAFPKIKEKLVREFVQSLACELHARLGKQWSIENNWNERPLKVGSHLALSKREWQHKASIGLWCGRAGPSDLEYFVWRKGKQKSPTITELKQALDEGCSHGNRCSHPDAENPWWKYVDDPYRDWSAESSLVALWKKNEAQDYYASHLLKLCEIGSPYLDRFCSTYPELP